MNAESSANLAGSEEEVGGEGFPRLQSESVLLLQFSSLPEPPTQNAILMLRRCFGRVVFFRNNTTFPPDFYLEAPELKEIGAACASLESRRKNALWKLARFGRYVLALRRELASRQYRLVVIHDYFALLAFHLAQKSAQYRGFVWFNSYDVIEPDSRPGRFTIQKMVISRHEKLFEDVDFFSLPTEERKRWYPIDRVKRGVFVIPNFPAVTYYQRFQSRRRTAPKDVIRLIYMGALGPGHGYEEIIPLLKTPVAGRSLALVLKGWIEETYKRTLIDLAQRDDVLDRLEFVGYGPYPQVAELAASCAIGLALFTGQNVMNRTLGTASNKIYEYAAVGMPVIFLDTPYWRSHFEHRSWAFFTDLTERSIRGTIETILSRYNEASAAAFQDFRDGFNFEKVFLPALRTVVNALSNSTNV